MRLIDADELRSEFGVSNSDIIAKETIDDAPTIDAVPVVRCRDCFYYKSFGECGNTGEQVKPDDFCSYGERREADHD